MEYHGKLYCKFGAKYVELKETSEDFDNLKAENKKLKSQFNWVKITGEESCPKYYDTILLSCLDEDNEHFYSLGYYCHEKEKYILDFGTEETNQHIVITHYLEFCKPE